MTDPIAEANRSQYIRALEQALRLLGFNPSHIQVYSDGSLTDECVAAVRAAGDRRQTEKNT